LVTLLVLAVVGRLGVEPLEQDADVFVQLVPVAVDNVEQRVVLRLPLLQLLDPLAQQRLGTLPLLQFLQSHDKERKRKLFKSEKLPRRSNKLIPRILPFKEKQILCVFLTRTYTIACFDLDYGRKHKDSIATPGAVAPSIY
jgi:hypothetical protein